MYDNSHHHHCCQVSLAGHVVLPDPASPVVPRVLVFPMDLVAPGGGEKDMI